MAGRPESPASLCGKYRFVWEAEQLMEEFGHDENVGGLTLTCQGEASLDNITGSVTFGRVASIFTALSEVRVEDSELNILKVRDDNGYAFVEFVCEAGWSACRPRYLTYIAKKQVDELRPEALSDAERGRLGMGLTAMEIKAIGVKSELIDGPIKPEADEVEGKEQKVPLETPKLENA